MNPKRYEGEIDEAFELFEYIDARFKDSLLGYYGESFYIDWGEDLYKVDRYGESVEKYKQSLEYNQISPEAHLGLGHAYHALKEMDSAIYYYQTAIDIYDIHSFSSSDFFYAFFRVGIYHYENGENRRAIPYYEEAILHKVAFHLSSGIAHSLLAQSLIKLEQEGETYDGISSKELKDYICELLTIGAEAQGEWAKNKLEERCGEEQKTKED